MNARLPHGSAAWFHMVGSLMCEAATQAGLPADLNVGLVERYTDGVQFQDRLMQGIRFDLRAGKPTFRIGAFPEERGDITVEVTVAASRELNALYGTDPRFRATLSRLQESGEMSIDGDLQRMGKWFETVHDRIVDRTA
jgi:hypothetical protein